jgi:NADPH:quinone reductase-like Zn-dependent oxidoreductase
MTMMKAVRIHSFGGPQVLTQDEVTRPDPEADELLVRVHAASINPVDWKIREGEFAPISEDRLPITLGRDVSGVIEAVGACVAEFKPGDEIYAMLGSDRGGYADYAIVKVDEAARKPRNLTHVQAAAVPLAAITAWQGLFDVGELRSGQRVLIHGAAGGVGHFAVQFAKAEGAFVYATASAGHVARLRQLGADAVIDYNARPFEEVVRKLDLVLDLIGGETQQRSWAVVKPGGALVSTVAEPSAKDAATHKARAASFMAEPNGAQLREIASLIELGEVEPIIQAVYPLSEVPAAQEISREGHSLGKIVLQVAA